ncbi:hypothetical protein [Arthrobacter sp. UYEF3]|uniref:hypothetical protein n=1 Tax=Arthrobacter sp. UYEF3 TaxID=1756365 RepID=UPI003397D8D4
MGKSGKTAIGAFLAALALLVLAGTTLHETVALWFLAASAVAYVACVAEVVIRRRHKTLLASGVGSILFIAFGIAFLRQWGLAFNAAPDALSAPVDAEYPDLYFYLCAAAGAATLLLLLAGTVLPGRGPARRTGFAARRPATRKPAARPAPRPSTSRTTARPAAPRPPVQRTAAPTPPRASAARTPTPRASTGRTPAPAAKRSSSTAKASAKAPVKPAAKTPVRPPAKAPTRR